MTRVLTFGRKVRETEFMRLLRHVPAGVPVDVLTLSPGGADEAAENLGAAGLDGARTTASGGFEKVVNGIGLPS